MNTKSSKPGPGATAAQATATSGPQQGTQTDTRLLLLNPQDNCVVVCQNLQAGMTLKLEGHIITLAQDIRLGHKLARFALKAGDVVYRYGAPIGSTLCAVQAGEHLHLHNLKSDYIPTYTRDEGERFAH